MDNKQLQICGVWVNPVGGVHVALKDKNNSRREEVLSFKPFVWTSSVMQTEGEVTPLKDGGQLNHLIHFNNLSAYQNYIKNNLCEAVRVLENQYLLQIQGRMFNEMRFSELRRMQLDIETGCSVEGGFSHANRKEDRVLAIGMQIDGINEVLILEDYNDASERKLLEKFNIKIKELDPDVIEGHNIFKFDFDYLKIRCAKLGIPCAWGRFGQEASFRYSKLRVAERWVEFLRCDIPGRTVFDTYLMIQLYDLTSRELTSYSLKNVAVALGITEKKDERTYIDGRAIHSVFKEDRKIFLDYLADDLRETKGLGDLLLPTYFAQVQTFPMTLQEATLRGTGTKIEHIFLEKYYHARQSLPMPMPIIPFEGGYTKGFETGVFNYVMSFDVASLYPSLLISMGKNPKSDKLGVFISTLKELREYRLEYKKLAKETTDVSLQKEYQGRQASFKILINSFYGYLGFEGARFADSELAAELTLKGRDLLMALIEKFSQLECIILEADTDGIYVSNSKYFHNPEQLLKEVNGVMPEGVELEFDGAYEAMFCYKAKNYAIREGNKVIIRGSALRSRGMEPFLKELTDTLIEHLLGLEKKNPKTLVQEMRKSIEAGEIQVESLAKSERLSQNPDTYARAVEKGGKSRRASLEVALKMKDVPTMGDRVTYYISKGEKARMPDWKVAQPIENYNPETSPYDRKYYLRKIEDWEDRYQEFLSSTA